MNKEFTFLNEIAYYLLNKSDFTHAEYHLSGSRLSGKSYSVAKLISTLIPISLKLKKNIGIYAFRKLNKDTTELVTEIYWALINIGFKENIHFTLKSPNKQAYFAFKHSKSFIRVMGVYSNSNSRIPLKGLSRSEIKNFDLCIDWREEANELTNNEQQAITFAQGVCKKKILITTCNPDSIHEEHIKYLNDIVPFNLQIMKTKHEQIKSILHNNKFKLFHYSNWKLNANNLDNDTINNLKELKLLDPVKAQAWYYGVPSILKGAIFARYLNNLKTKLDFTPTEILGGLDIGMASSSTGHPTAASLWLFGKNSTGYRLHKESEYYHSNNPNERMQFKDTDKLAEDIINYYVKEARIYPQMYYGFTCNVDYGNGGQVFIDVLNSKAIKKGFHWLRFKGVEKEIIRLNDRIDFTTIAMIKNIISINWERCPYTKKQYNLIQWVDKPNIENSKNNNPGMIDLHDDTWDSDIYAQMSKMRLIMQSLGNTLLIKKDRW